MADPSLTELSPSAEKYPAPHGIQFPCIRKSAHELFEAADDVNLLLATEHRT
jgi:hypothetical protein